MPNKKSSPKLDRATAIDSAVASIERMFGKGAIMRFGEKNAAGKAPASRNFRRCAKETREEKPTAKNNEQKCGTYEGTEICFGRPDADGLCREDVIAECMLSSFTAFPLMACRRPFQKAVCNF